MHKKVICIIFALIVIAHATTYYVATNGLNSNPGTITHPWQTISYATSASSAVIAGDTICVRAGNYPEQIFPEISGSQTNPIVLMNFPDEIVTLNPGRIQFDNGADYWKVEGLIFLRSSANGLRVTGTHPLRFLTISNCSFSSHDHNGIVLSGPDFGGVTIEDCVIDSNGTVSEGHAILMYDGVGVLWAHRNLIIDNEGKGITHATEAAWQADSSVIDSNIIINCLASGIDWWGDNSFITHNYLSHNGVRDPEPNEWGDKGLALDQNASGNLVAFNVIKSSGRWELAPRGSGNCIYNNTLIKDYYYSTVPGSPGAAIMIFFASSGSGNEFRNNIFVNLVEEDYHHYAIIAENVSKYTDNVWSNNLYWCSNATPPPEDDKPFKLYGFPGGDPFATLSEIQTQYPTQEIGSIYDNPDFVSYADSNFHLLPGSPAIDAGTYVGFPYYGDAPDMGAFEFNPAGIISFEESPNNGLRMQVYPNPFCQTIEIEFQLSGVESSKERVTSIEIYDVTGRTVKQFNHLTIPPFNQITWNGTDDFGKKLPAGVYFACLKTDDFSIARKIVKTK